MEKGSGEKFIDALARRGLRGSYFDFEGYRTLRSLKSDGELLQFLKQQGIDGDLDLSNVDEVIERIALVKAKNTLSDPMFWVLADPTGILFFISLPFIAAYGGLRLLRKWIIG